MIQPNEYRMMINSVTCTSAISKILILLFIEKSNIHREIFHPLLIIKCTKVIYNTLNNNDSVPPVIARCTNDLLKYIGHHSSIQDCINVYL